MEDGDIILTDLDSTNGTRVNGTAIQIRRLRAGDQVSVGRSMLLFGVMEEIAARKARPPRATPAGKCKRYARPTNFNALGGVSVGSQRTW